jgi:hypothetical protein
MGSIRHLSLSLCLTVFAGGLGLSSPAFAAGALDWADPCVDAQVKFSSNSAAARYRVDQVIQEWDSRTEPPGELRGLYVEAIREGAYKAWSDDPGAKTLLDAMKASDPNFDAHNLFITQIYPKVMTPEKEAEYVRLLYKADYDAKFRPELIKSRNAIEDKISAEKQTMDGSCKTDVLSQVLRGTIGNALILLGSNWSAAQNESGEVAKYFRAASGISLTDIEKYGIRGGENSELRKLLGSDESVASQVVKALDPTQWKVDLPKISPPTINLPNIPAPKIDPPTVTLPGNVRVCVPWC